MKKRIGSMQLVLGAVLVGAVWLGCTKEPETASEIAESSNPYAALESEIRRSYPNVAALYTGDLGIYRGCGPNNGVCHNSREFPNLATMGSLVENIGLPCNEKREDPTQIHDLCERLGDFLRIGTDRGVEIAFIDDERDPSQAPAGSRAWKMKLRDRVPAAVLASVSSARISIVRVEEGTKDTELIVLDDFGAKLVVDPSDASMVTIVAAALPTPNATPTDEESEIEDDVLGPLLTSVGPQGDPLKIHVGDPNRNGTFGASIGGRIIAPGDPARSYIFTRLTDPSAGPVMPRANCCFWTKASLRALWCWVAGLAPDGKNALEPIAYDSCPPGPPDTMAYPSPGPSCETSGMCPLQPMVPVGSEPTFSNVYTSVLKQNCLGCHVSSSSSGGGRSAGGLDMGSKDRAYKALLNNARVVAGDAKGSLLFQRISPDLCKEADGCATMPKGMPFLGAGARTLVEQWITAGAKND